MISFLTAGDRNHCMVSGNGLKCILPITVQRVEDGSNRACGSTMVRIACHWLYRIYAAISGARNKEKKHEMPHV